MKKYTVNYNTNKHEINALANESALTWEGMSTSDKNLKDITQWLKSNDALTDENLIYHVTSGKLMNESYNLTGSNAYPDDLTILSVTGINLCKVITARLFTGGRWLDDIIDNNMESES